MANKVGIAEIGFTGTRAGMTLPQLQETLHLLELLNGDYFNHGCCVGSDEEAAILARHRDYWIVGHPPIDRKHLSTFQNDEEYEPEEYLKRNKAIVDSSEVMIATPGGQVEVLRSGTWATIRYARERNRQLYIIYPDGRLVYYAGS